MDLSGAKSAGGGRKLTLQSPHCTLSGCSASWDSRHCLAQQSALVGSSQTPWKQPPTSIWAENYKRLASWEMLPISKGRFTLAIALMGEVKALLKESFQKLQL